MHKRPWTPMGSALSALAAVALFAPSAQAGRTVFVNFDGGKISGGANSAQANTSTSSNIVGTYEPYGSGSRRAALWQIMKQIWGPVELELVDTRPASGPYMMCMAGDKVGQNQNFYHGIATLHCNASEPNTGSCAAYIMADDENSATVQARILSQEIAHNFGLEHIEDERDVLFPGAPDVPAEFVDECVPIVKIGGGSARCTEQHMRSCGSANLQNSFAELTYFLSGGSGGTGGGGPDVAPPTLSFVNPVDGGVVEVGETLVVSVDATDDNRVDKVVLRLDEKLHGTVVVPPYEWSMTFESTGMHTLRAIASDPAGMEAEATVTFEVVPEGTAPDPDPVDADGDTGTGGFDTDGPLLPTGGGAFDDAAGCGCRDSAPSPTWALALGLLALRRRRD